MKIKVENFEGPLGLLLQLIEKEIGRASCRERV